MLELKTEFDRLRAVKGQKDTIKLITTIKNLDEKPIAATLLIRTPFSLGFDAIGLEREKRIRIEKVKPKSEEIIRTELYLKQNVSEGFLPMQVELWEHPEGRFDKAAKTHIVKLNLKVIKP